jgi:uncharacterized protein (TIGR03000 family)
MYSVVLMMSMTAAPETPSWFFHHHYSCHGCYGSCYGCSGSCYGSCYGSCSGVAYGSYRPWYSSCYGCYGSYSGCYGYGIYGGASYAWPYPYYSGSGGCYGYGAPIPAYTSPTPMTPGKTEEKLPEPKKTYLPVSPDQARVIVRLPTDAKLFANGQLTDLTSSERWFSTPVIAKDRDFQYTMKIEYTRDGKNLSDSKIVKVRAGEVSVVEFAELGTTDLVTSIIKVNAPANAKVFVQDRQELPEGAKEFRTPPLSKGREYAYSFRAEVSKDGKKQSQTQRVSFKAGEPVTVDFTEMVDAPRTASTN